MERVAGRSPDRCSTGDSQTTLDPLEVLFPDVEPGIEEAYELAISRILGRDPTALVLVAEATGEPEIVFDGRASQRGGEEVVHFHRCPGDGLTGQAITAAVAGLLGDAPTQGLRDVDGAQGSLSRQETS